MARSWWRWGRQLDAKLQQNPDLRNSLGLTAQKAWYDHSYGFSADGHGVLLAGPEEGICVGQQA